MKITYDIEHLPEHKARGGKKSEETLALIAFLAGQKKNMCIEYDNAQECKRRYDSLRNYRNSNKLQNVYDIWREDKRIYIVKLKKAGARRGE